jgi:tRNA(His) 5'-end guanylyltransferase
LTAARFQKPFDPAFRDLMVQTAQALMHDLHGLYAYIESDEISVLFPPAWDRFDRKLEKVVSISAAIASAAFTHMYGVPVQFDSRVWLGAKDESVVDYFRWRQADAARCALNGWCYWTLRQSGASVEAATAALQGASVADKNELLFRHGINFNNLPTWQRRGTGLYWETYTKEGYNPKSRQKTLATRRRLKVDQDLPMKDAYAQLIGRLMHTSAMSTKRSGSP